MAEVRAGRGGRTQPPSQRICEKVERILGNIRETGYQHKTLVSEEHGVYRVDCSGLVDYVLMEVAFEHYQQIPQGRHGRPLATHFYEYFMSLPQRDSGESGEWSRIERMAWARRGDILACKYTPETRERKGTTGHVLILLSEPRKLRSGEYVVTVADSARTPHGNDSRHGSESGAGVGRGKMWFGTDEDDHPIYYRRGEPTSPRNESDIEGIAIGRAL